MEPSWYEKTVPPLEILCCLFCTENSLFITRFYSMDPLHTVLKADRIFKVMVENFVLDMSVMLG